MSTAHFSRPAADVCKGVELPDGAAELLTKRPTVSQFLGQLAERDEFAAAMRVAAHALPIREAVWWASQCAKTAGPSPALTAAERWVIAPSDETRRAAMTAAESAGLATPAGCVALAAFLSGGSLGPADVAEVPPPAGAAAQAAGGAVALVAVIKEPEKAAERYKKFLALANDVAAGTNRWPVK